LKRLTIFLLFLGLALFPQCTPKKGKIVTSVLNSGGYTYAEIEEAGKKYWIATSQRPIAAGDNLQFSKGQPMKNFPAKSLNRTFDEIYFISDLIVLAPGSVGAKGQDMSEKGHTGAPQLGSKGIAKGSIAKAAGGYTVEEIHNGNKSLKGKSVKIRAVVVKFSPNIMDKNWLHIQDGSGSEKTADLTVTTKDTVAKGATVMVSGTVFYDKDFGQGYKYPVIVENAKLTVEK
jgi:hypothetical protein